ncbi:MAG: tripartite tricarboxylate transporter substrate binding protein [Betaproteobacteria bacterium]|nr:tripartite tricarboxylate transporter substrate binding protein [Betaproteobacteria bacterium]MBI2961974.1 tripartite tricarboxylate transporter substrate binding protein [Betaproteobacteria bacterium]
MKRRLLPITLLATMLCVVFSVPALAQQFPTKPVRLVIPWTAGGSTDVLGRALANELTKVWGQPVVVENPAGAGSVIGADRVANSAPDGYTLMMTIDTTTVHNRFLYKLPYDPDKSFTPITIVARSGQFVITNPAFPAKNLRELVDYARKNPGKVAYASYGQGSQPELFFETLGKREGVQFLKVPYKGVADCIRATVAGEVQATISSPAASGSQVRAEKVRPIAIGGPQRTSLFPNVPTITESGYPYADAGIWFGLFAPGGMNPQLVERIHRDTIAIIKRPDFVEKFIKGFSLDLVGNTPAEFTAVIGSNVKMIAEMVKAAGVKQQ